METEAIQKLTILLKAIASTNPPNWVKPLKAYPNFDWSVIGATVHTHDEYGAASVAWCGHLYIRRCGQNRKYGAAIWFSRGNGKDDDGEINYLRLITFRNVEIKAEPLPDYVAKSLR
jgi:DdrB-like protein